MEYLKVNQLSWPPTARTIVQFISVFLIILVSAKFGQYVFYEFNTLPAILWPPTGIGVAVMWLYGYRFVIPIFLGLLVASFTGPTANYWPGVITTPMSQVAGQMLGVYLLNRFKFEGEFTNVRNVLIFFGSIISLAIVSPIVTTTIQYLTGTLNGNYFISFSRMWAGYAFSCLILTPFIISWSLPDSFKIKSNLLETILTGATVTVATYFLFWFRYPQEYGLGIFALFFFTVIWVCLRFSSRIVTLTVIHVTIFGILGLFVAPNPERALNQQIFATELLLFIVVPIMYAYSALVKERQINLQQLQYAFSRIEQENENKSNFIAVLAHELRNPLAPIKTTFEILKLQNLDPEVKPLIESAHKQVQVMRRLLDDLLDVTRVTQGKFELKTETVQLQPLLESVINATKDTVSDHGHILELKTHSKESIVVMVDPIRFEQVLVNVINNAAKYTDRGGRIEIAYSVNGECLEVQIKDTGKGIAAENLERIFDSFWQIRDSSPASAAGIGVGLALSRQIIQLHGGSIKAESMGLGKGSTFVISLPCKKRALKIEKVAPTTKPLSAHSILVVDDNKAAADALTTLLTMKGHEVHTAYSGMEALEKVQVNTPQIVLLDIGLPDVSGYEVAKSVRENGYTGALFAVSGYGQEDDKQKALTSGFDWHFTKPLAIQTLEEYLHTWEKSST